MGKYQIETVGEAELEHLMQPSTFMKGELMRVVKLNPTVAREIAEIQTGFEKEKVKYSEAHPDTEYNKAFFAGLKENLDAIPEDAVRLLALYLEVQNVAKCRAKLSGYTATIAGDVEEEEKKFRYRTEERFDDNGVGYTWLMKIDGSYVTDVGRFDQKFKQFVSNRRDTYITLQSAYKDLKEPAREEAVSFDRKAVELEGKIRQSLTLSNKEAKFLEVYYANDYASTLAKLEDERDSSDSSRPPSRSAVHFSPYLPEVQSFDSLASLGPKERPNTDPGKPSIRTATPKTNHSRGTS